MCKLESQCSIWLSTANFTINNCAMWSGKKNRIHKCRKKNQWVTTDDPKSVREMYSSKGTKARIDVEEETVCEHGWIERPLEAG